jgi:hypothetical protein
MSDRTEIGYTEIMVDKGRYGALMDWNQKLTGEATSDLPCR